MDEWRSLARDVHDGLATLGHTAAAAESLTGGLVAAALTANPGAGETFRGGVVVYATDLKESLAGVPASLLAENGPVAAPTASALAAGAAVRCATEWAVATTGVAGPTEQDGHAPGEVFVAVRGPGIEVVRRHLFSGERDEIRNQSVTAALSLLATNVARVRDGR